MLVALVGIISVQWYWISNSVKVKEQQFDKLVITSLNDVVSSLENEESVMFIANQFINIDGEVDSLKKQPVVRTEKNDSSKIVQLTTANTNDISIKIESILDDKKDSNKVITSKKVIVNNNVITPLIRVGKE